MSSWVPNTFFSKGNELKLDKKYLEKLLKDGRRLVANGVPVIFTLNHLARITDVSITYLQRIVQRRYEPYRVFNISKRSGGYRQISVPEDRLIIVQRWIHQNVLKKIKTHSSSTAFMSECSTFKNAREHCGAKWLVKIDIRRFFESISERQVYHVFRALGYKDLLSFELARLTTKLNYGSRKYRSKRWKTNSSHYKFYNYGILGHLPQGAPTSPLLANMVCYSLDEKLYQLAERYNCTYTRYADDIVFSGMDLDRTKSEEIISDISSELSKCGFKQNTRKTHIIPPGARKIITGLIVNDSAPKIPKEFREKIEVHLYYAKKFGVAEHCKKRGFISIYGFQNHLDGLIKYVEQVDIARGAKYRKQYYEISFPDIL